MFEVPDSFQRGIMHLRCLRSNPSQLDLNVDSFPPGIRPSMTRYGRTLLITESPKLFRENDSCD